MVLLGISSSGEEGIQKLPVLFKLEAVTRAPDRRREDSEVAETLEGYISSREAPAKLNNAATGRGVKRRKVQPLMRYRQNISVRRLNQSLPSVNGSSRSSKMKTKRHYFPSREQLYDYQSLHGGPTAFSGLGNGFGAANDVARWLERFGGAADRDDDSALDNGYRSILHQLTEARSLDSYHENEASRKEKKKPVDSLSTLAANRRAPVPRQRARKKQSQKKKETSPDVHTILQDEKECMSSIDTRKIKADRDLVRARKLAESDAFLDAQVAKVLATPAARATEKSHRYIRATEKPQQRSSSTLNTDTVEPHMRRHKQLLEQYRTSLLPPMCGAAHSSNSRPRKHSPDDSSKDWLESKFQSLTSEKKSYTSQTSSVVDKPLTEDERSDLHSALAQEPDASLSEVNLKSDDEVVAQREPNTFEERQHEEPLVVERERQKEPIILQNAANEVERPEAQTVVPVVSKAAKLKEDAADLVLAGAIVLAPFDGILYPGVIARVLTNENLVDIRFDDGDTASNVQVTDLVIQRRQWSIGDTCLCQWLDGAWYGGAVTHVNPGGKSVNVRFDDGDTKENVLSAHLQYTGEASSSASDTYNKDTGADSTLNQSQTFLKAEDEERTAATRQQDDSNRDDYDEYGAEDEFEVDEAAENTIDGITEAKASSKAEDVTVQAPQEEEEEEDASSQKSERDKIESEKPPSDKNDDEYDDDEYDEYGDDEFDEDD